MAINLVESVQQKLNIEKLQKIDPDTSKVIDAEKPSDKFYQLAIPVVLTGLYSFTRIDEDNRDILNMKSENLLSSFFGENNNTVMAKIAGITKAPPHEIKDKLENIAGVVISILKENLSEKSLDRDVKDFLTGQRHNILLYLDPALQLGKYIEDETIDDSTNKMEGPVSDLMHKIGQIFSESGNDKKNEI